MSIPGYAGYRPGIAANQHIAKTVTEQSRGVFSQKHLDKCKNDLATTGFNFSLIPKMDATREAKSRRYGNETMFVPHPNHHPENYFTTTTRASFPDPKSQPKANFRTRN